MLSMTVRPASRRIWMRIERVADIDPRALLDAGVRGVLVDMDGTLVPHHDYAFGDETRAVLAGWVRAGLRVAIYSNAARQEGFGALGVRVVGGVPLKPSAAGFRAAMRQGLGLVDPAQVVMIGDNPITDGAAVDAGLRFIHCRPLPGREGRGHRVARSVGGWLSRPPAER